MALVMLLASQAQAHDWRESPAVGELFQRAGMEGTFVLYDVAARTYRGHDETRANQRFVPASTFKIPNSLIGLTVGAVAGPDEVLPYRGDPHPFIQEWARDMSLREAIRLSNVPIYQALARRVGLARMGEQVARLDYGNRDIGTQVDRFWLDGPLQISAMEQVRFLARLAEGSLPFPAAAQAAVRDITRLERGPGWTLHGKTGWRNAPRPDLGWWVGWVDRQGRIFAFALNLDMRRAEDAGKRLELGKASLKALGVL